MTRPNEPWVSACAIICRTLRASFCSTPACSQPRPQGLRYCGGCRHRGKTADSALRRVLRPDRSDRRVVCAPG
jgi:hypothetical protein